MAGRRIFKLLNFWAALAVLSAPLAGCLLLNDVSEIHQSDWVSPGSNRAVLLYGVGVESAWSSTSFSIDLDEYDVAKGQNKGNCWRHNHTKATVLPVVAGPVRYFAFSVEPGFYAYSGFNGAGLSPPYDGVAYKATAGQITYIGDFILTGLKGDPRWGNRFQNGSVVVRQNIDAVRMVAKDFGSLNGNPVSVETIPIKPQNFIFVCAP